jgi:hypothetical protein
LTLAGSLTAGLVLGLFTGVLGGGKLKRLIDTLYGVASRAPCEGMNDEIDASRWRSTVRKSRSRGTLGTGT